MPDSVTENDVDTREEIDDRAGVRGAVSSRRERLVRLAVYGLMPALVVLLAAGAAVVKWRVGSMRSAVEAQTQSVAAAKDAAIALLSYQPDNVEKDLGDASAQWLTGSFKDSYSQLIHDVVVPGARQHRISAVASVPAAASVSATSTHAVALVFLNQTVLVGNEAPSETGSSVRVTLDKVGGRWLVSAFDPV